MLWVPAKARCNVVMRECNGYYVTEVGIRVLKYFVQLPVQDWLIHLLASLIWPVLPNIVSTYSSRAVHKVALGPDFLFFLAMILMFSRANVSSPFFTA